MKLKDVYTSAIADVIKNMEIVDMKVHTNNQNDVATIELKFQPKAEETEKFQF